MSVLLPAEKMVLTIARAQIERGDEVPPSTTAFLVLALERIAELESALPSESPASLNEGVGE